MYTVLPSVFSTIPTWSEVPSPFQSKKIRVPGAGEYPRLFHFPLLWNHAIPSSHRENFGIFPLSIRPAWSPHQLAKQAHHATWLSNPYHDQNFWPPWFPSWVSATDTICRCLQTGRQTIRRWNNTAGREGHILDPHRHSSHVKPPVHWKTAKRFLHCSPHSFGEPTLCTRFRSYTLQGQLQLVHVLWAGASGFS